MSLVSNSLYLDSEYKADCESKINYLSYLNLNGNSKDVITHGAGVDLTTKDNKNILNNLETKLVYDETNKPYISDSQYLYNTKRISKNHYKLILETFGN